MKSGALDPGDRDPRSLTRRILSHRPSRSAGRPDGADVVAPADGGAADPGSGIGGLEQAAGGAQAGRASSPAGGSGPARRGSWPGSRGPRCSPRPGARPGPHAVDGRLRPGRLGPQAGDLVGRASRGAASATGRSKPTPPRATPSSTRATRTPVKDPGLRRLRGRRGRRAGRSAARMAWRCMRRRTPDPPFWEMAKLAQGEAPLAWRACGRARTLSRPTGPDRYPRVIPVPLRPGSSGIHPEHFVRKG
jgi:hypothetical protein